MPVVAVFLLAGAVATPAFGQGPSPLEKGRVAVEKRLASTDTLDRKSPGRAVRYSLAGTLVLAPAFGAGLIVGPSFGHFYAGNSGQAWAGIGIRAGGAALFLWGVSSEFSELCLFCGSQQGAGDGPELDEAAGLIGPAVVLSSAVYDIVTADNSARQYNRSHGLRARIHPTVGGPKRDHVGLAVRIQF